MSAILRSTVLLYASSRRQRALLGIGLLITIGGPVMLRVAVPAREFIPALYSGLDFLLTGVLAFVLGLATVTFRAASAPRMLLLVPLGRLRLSLAMLLAPVPLALLITIYVALLSSATPALPLAWGSLTGTFVGTLSVEVLFVSWCFFFVGGALWFQGASMLLLVLGASVLGEHSWSIRNAVGIDAMEFFPALALIALPLFISWYLRAKRITPPNLEGHSLGRSMLGAEGSVHLASERSAFRVYLLGQPSLRRACWSAWVAILGMDAALLLMGRSFPHFSNSHLTLRSSELFTLVFIVGSAFRFSSMIARRSRLLWIRSGCTRLEIFEAVERLSLACLAFVAVPILVLCTAGWIILAHDGVRWWYPLLVTAATSLCGVYLGLNDVTRESVGNVLFIVFL